MYGDCVGLPFPPFAETFYVKKSGKEKGKEDPGKYYIDDDDTFQRIINKLINSHNIQPTSADPPLPSKNK